MLCDAHTQASLTHHINHSSFPVESELFTGHCRVYVEGLPESPDALFSGRQRHTHVILQVCCVQVLHA